MKSKLTITVIILLMAPTIAKAQTTAPQYFNLQSVLTDSGGNVLYDLQETNITFQIVDGGGEVYYTETQRVPVANGAISVLIGQGTDPTTGQSTGGIPYDAISPEGDRYIRYQLEDDTIPADELQLHSVPYSYYAQYAIDLPEGTVTTDHILNGTITEDDLSQTFLDFIDQSMSGVSQADLEAHKTAVGDHTASVITVDNTFSHASGSTLQGVLETLDDAVSIQDEDISDMEGDITNMETTVNNLDGDLQAHIITDINDAHPGTVDEDKIDPDIARDTEIITDHGDLTGLSDDDHPQYGALAQDEAVTGSWSFSAAPSSISPTSDSHLATKQYVDSSVVSDHGSLSGLGDDDHPQYFNQDGSESMGGTLDMNGNEITNVGSQNYSVGSKLYNHENRIYALENPGNQPVIFAMANVDQDANFLGTPYNISSVNDTAGSCVFTLTFSDTASDDYSYVIVGNVINANSNNHVRVNSQSTSSFEIEIVDSQNGCEGDADFNVMVYEYDTSS